MNFGDVVLLIPPLLLAISVHEWAHGMSALYYGDPTAKMSGRLTLNPMAHFDPVGTTMLLFTALVFKMPFGWAKPVPVNYYNLRSPKQQMALVAAAGPASNIMLAIASVLIIRGLAVSGVEIHQLYMPLVKMLQFSVLVNCGLAVFNILPIHPLDGSRILTGLLPYPYSEQYARLEPYGFFILIFLIMTHLTDIVLLPLWKMVFGLMAWVGGGYF